MTNPTKEYLLLDFLKTFDYSIYLNLNKVDKKHQFENFVSNIIRTKSFNFTKELDSFFQIKKINNNSTTSLSVNDFQGKNDIDLVLNYLNAIENRLKELKNELLDCRRTLKYFCSASYKNTINTYIDNVDFVLSEFKKDLFLKEYNNHKQDVLNKKIIAPDSFFKYSEKDVFHSVFLRGTTTFDELFSNESKPVVFLEKWVVYNKNLSIPYHALYVNKIEELSFDFFTNFYYEIKNTSNEKNKNMVNFVFKDNDITIEQRISNMFFTSSQQKAIDYYEKTKEKVISLF